MLEIEKLEEQFVDMTNTELINYIFKRHHAFLKEELDRLKEEIYVLYQVYHEDYDCFLERVYFAFSDLKTNFEVHMIKEEKSIFLHIKEYEINPTPELRLKILKEIEGIEKNNNEIEYYIKEIKRLTNNFTIATEEHSAFDGIYRKLKNLQEETIGHFNLERNIIHDRMEKSEI